MSRLNVVALGAALLIGVAGVAGAQTQTEGKAQGQVQNGEGYGRHRGEFGARMAKDLNLTATQKSQIKAIHQKYRSQFESIRAQVKAQAGSTSGAAPEKGRRGGFRNVSPELRQRMLTLRTQEQSEIRSVLTPEQRTKFDAAQVQRKQWMQNHRKEAGKKA